MNQLLLFMAIVLTITAKSQQGTLTHVRGYKVDHVQIIKTGNAYGDFKDAKLLPKAHYYAVYKIFDLGNKYYYIGPAILAPRHKHHKKHQ